MYFNLRKTAVYDAIIFYRMFPIGLLRFFRVILLYPGFTVLFIFGARYVLSRFAQLEVNLYFSQDFLLGLSFILIPTGFSVLFFELFGRNYLRYPAIKDRENLADRLEYNCARIRARATAVSYGLGEKETSVRSLIFAILDDGYIDGILVRIIPNFIKVKADVKKIIGSKIKNGLSSSHISQPISEELLKLISDADKTREEHDSEKISILDILASLFDYSPEFKQFIINQDLDKGDLKELAHWYEEIWSFRENIRKFWRLENLLRQPPVGRGWVYGFSPYLRGFSINLTDKFESSFPVFKLVSRKREIEQMEQVLSRSGKNNILIVGEDGVGRERLISDFVELIAKGQALPQLNYKKVFELNVPMATSATKDVLGVQNIIISILNEAVKAGNIILVMKDIHNFIGEIGGLGRIDISEILVPYLKSTRLQFIATTNPASFHKFIETRSEVSNSFERMDVSEPDRIQTMRVLEEIVPSTENRFGVMVSYGALKNIVDGADKYIRTSPFPEKAVDLLSEVISYSVSKKKKLVTVQEVNEVISRKTGIPLGPIAGEESEKLSNLEKIMHQQLVGQERAVEVVSATMRRLRTGLAKRGKPAGVFLFIGPTGVGKTLTSKILAETYYGSENRMIRFDMSEYQEIESMDRFLGNLRANEPGQFVSAVRDNPFSLVLLDELEKANKNILNIFLQVFDEGKLTDVFGRKVNFEQNIIIATSNAGAESIREMVKEGLDPSMEKEKIIDILIKGKYFSPEFLNRFDEIVIFHPLSQSQIADIAKILVKSLASRLLEQGYMFKPNQEVTDYISKIGFDPQFGARPMQRVIRDKIENAIAKKILDKTIRKGEEFSLTIEDIS